MKNLMFVFCVVFILFCGSICFSEIKGYVEVGKDLNSNIAYTELQIGYNFRFWNIILMPYGNTQTWFEYKGANGYPFKDIYTIGTQLKFENITIDLSHFCSHEVVSSSRSYIYDYEPPKDGNLTKLSVRYDF